MPPETILLWPAGAPGAAPGPQEERASWLTPPEPRATFRGVRNVTQPAMLAYLPPPELATGTAVVVCPGGGHHLLSIDHEGIDVAEWLAARGIAAFVLKYRLLPSPAADEDFATRFWELMSDPTLLPPLLTPEHRATFLADGQRAVALLRERAAEWRLAPDRIGILGFSAGGHVAAAVALHHTPESRPDFVAPIYAGMWEAVRRAGRRAADVPRARLGRRARRADRRRVAQALHRVVARGPPGRAARLRHRRPRLRHAPARPADRRLDRPLPRVAGAAGVPRHAAAAA